MKQLSGSALRITAAVAMTAACVVVFSRQAFAMTVPAAGSLLYSLYDYGVLQGLHGAPGFMGGVGLIILGAINIVKHPLAGVPALVAGIVLTSADVIVISMGMTI